MSFKSYLENIPNHWKIVTLPEVISFIVDNRGKTVPTAADGIPLIATNCIKNDALYPVKEKVRYVSEDTYKNWFKSYPKPGDIIFVNKGTPGRVCMVPENIDFCFAQDMIALRANNEIYNNYLFALLRTTFFQEQVMSYSVGTMIPHCRKTDFEKLVLPLPPYEEQKKIGDIYYNLSNKIELNNQMNETLEEMAQVLFKRWFVDFEFQNQEGQPYKSSGGEMVGSELGMIPKGWSVLKLDDIGEVVAGGTPSTKCQEYYDGNISWITPKDLSGYNRKFIQKGGRSITELGLQKSSAKMMPKGSVLFSSRAPIGYIVIADNSLCTNQGFKSIVCNEKYMFKNYIYYLLKQEKDKIISIASGSTFKEVSGTTMKNYKIIVPPLRILEKFENVVKTYDDILKKNYTENDLLTEIRNSLLPKLMSGEIRVSDLKS